MQKIRFLFLALGLVLVSFTLSGCIAGLMEKIPDHAFTRFTYNRAGNLTSAHIEAVNAKQEGKYLKIESLSIQENFGPMVNFSMSIEGYERKLIK